MLDERAEVLLESLDRHYAAGCPALLTSQLREHEATGACRECSERARVLAGNASEARSGVA